MQLKIDDLLHMPDIDNVKIKFNQPSQEEDPVDDQVILERESWWKETLQSRKFGYNAN